MFKHPGEPSTGSGLQGFVVPQEAVSTAVLAFFTQEPPSIVAMQAHFWALESSAIGREVRLVPPACVKQFVKRQKNDDVDREASAEPASRPTMRFVEPKTPKQQAPVMVFRIRYLFVR